jgi:hypothetical protein
MRRQIPLVFLVSLFLPIVVSSQKTARVFPPDRSRGEGKMWLEWDKSQREGFVTGYVWGLERGFNRGCLTFDQVSPHPEHEKLDKTKDLLDNPLQHCMEKLLIFSKSIGYYESQITRFYETYQKDQDLPLQQLFLQLADSSSNKTLEQIHFWYQNP